MALTDELATLFELFKAGALSAEEFKLAKEKLLGAGDESSPALPNAPRTKSAAASTEDAPVLAVETAAPTTCAVCALGDDEPPLYQPLQEDIDARFAHLRGPVTRLIQYQQREFGPVAYRARLSAYQHLYKLFENLARAPQKTQFRRLRVANPVLSREVWPVPGCLALVRACGFAEEDAPITVAHSGAGPLTHGQASWLVLKLDDASTVAYAQEALNAIVFCRNEMAEKEKRGNVTRGLLTNNVPLEIRLENARAAAAKGELTAFCVELLTKDDAGDDLRTVVGHLGELVQLMTMWGTAVSRASDAPEEAEDMTVGLDDLRWYRAVVRQRGALEWLLVGAHAQLQEKRVTTLCQGAHADTTPTTTVVAAKLALPVRAPESEVWQRQAAEALNDMVARVETARQARLQTARDRASATAAVMLRREKKRLAHIEERAAERNAQRDSSTYRRVGASGAVQSLSPPNDDSDDEEAAPCDAQEDANTKGTAPSTGAGGKRVPLSKALAFLMGREVPVPSH